VRLQRFRPLAACLARRIARRSVVAAQRQFWMRAVTFAERLRDPLFALDAGRTQ
jgi:hypothetical protein